MANFRENPEQDIKTETDVSDRMSLSSAITGSTIPPPPYQQSQSLDGFENPIPEVPIRPSTVLTVQAKGTRFVRFPTPSPELEIVIFNGTNTSAKPVYTSTRPKRGSGNATLRHFAKGDLLATTYRFGPFREPEIRRIGVHLDSKLTESDNTGDLAVKISTGSRTVTFTSMTDDSKSFTWEYKKTVTAGGKKRRLMVLFMHDSSPSAEWRKDQMLAALVRTDDTRTPGTKKSDAGNGGLLVLDQEATVFMNEEMIIATCLMMLKKEIDRQRMIQIAIMAGGAGGGGG